VKSKGLAVSYTCYIDGNSSAENWMGVYKARAAFALDPALMQ